MHVPASPRFEPFVRLPRHALALLLLLLPGLAAAEVEIPSQGAWVDRGIVLEATRRDGVWNAEFAGVGPCALLKKNGLYYLFYIGSDGDRMADAGPRHRRLGVATCPVASDCTSAANWSEDPANPILDFRPNLDSPNDEWGEEEGIWTCEVLEDGPFLRMYFGGMTNGVNPQSVNDDGYVVTAADASDPTVWPHAVAASTKILSNSDADLWGNGDELDPIAAWKVGNVWHWLYQVGTGYNPPVSWGVGYVRGTDFDRPDPTTSREWLHKSGSGIFYRGNCKQSRISTTHRAIFCEAWDGSSTPGRMEVYRISDSNPESAGQVRETYDFGSDHHNTVVFLDEEEGTWWMFYRDRDADYIWETGDSIRVKTAPVSGSSGLLGSPDGSDPPPPPPTERPLPPILIE